MISVCFITKNEASWIGKCIEQLEGIVSEIILVDTGSIDQTVEIAKKLNAKIFHFEWAKNFSEARNFALSKATQPWVLKIDPDERIDRSHLLKLVEYTKTNVLGVRARTRSYTNSSSAVCEDAFRACCGDFPAYEKDYRGFKEINYLRLFRRLPGVCYSGIIHEDVEPSIRLISGDANSIQTASEVIFHNYGSTNEETMRKDKDQVYKKMMEQEISSNSKNWFVWYELGNQYYQSGDFEQAAAIFRKAYELDPEQPETLINLGHNLCLTGHREEGEKLLREAIRLAPENPNAWINLGISRMDADDLKTAQQCFQSALRLHSDSLVAWRAFGQCLAKIGDFQNAEVAFRQALARYSGFTEAKIDLAILYVSVGRELEGQQLLRESMIESPNNERAAIVLKESFGVKKMSSPSI